MDTSLLKLNITTVADEPCTATLKIEVAAEQAKTIYNTVKQAVSARVAIPGFRAGKVPDKVLMRNYGARIGAEAADRIISAAFPQAVKETGIEQKVVGQPMLVEEESDKEAKADQPFKFAVKFDTKPEVPEINYKELTLKSSKKAVTDEDITKTIDQYREMSSQFKTSEEPSTQGAIMVASYEATIPEGLEIPENSKYFVKAENTWLALREPELLPGISTALLGMRPGDERDVELTFPQDFKAAEVLQGKTLKYNFKVSEIRVSQVPEFNEEFAKKFGCESTDKMTEMVRKNLEEQTDAKERSEFIDQITETLFNPLDFPLPPSQLANAKEAFLRNMIAKEERKGTEKADIDAKMDELKAQTEQEVVVTLRRIYALQAIAKIEDITFTEEDSKNMMMFFLQQADSKSKDFTKMLAEMRENGEVDAYVQSTILSRTYDKIIDYAKIERA